MKALQRYVYTYVTCFVYFKHKLYENKILCSQTPPVLVKDKVLYLNNKWNYKIQPLHNVCSLTCYFLCVGVKMIISWLVVFGYSWALCAFRIFRNWAHNKWRNRSRYSYGDIAVIGTCVYIWQDPFVLFASLARSYRDRTGALAVRVVLLCRA
jgi:hypothetical protein